MSDVEQVNNKIVLDSLLECNASCAGNFSSQQFKHEEDTIDWLFKNLPTAKYVVDQIVNYIFSNGLTTGDEKQDEILDSFLYADNIKGTTNYSVIRESVRNSLVYSKAGIRFLSEEAGLLNVDSKSFGALKEEDEEFYGFDKIVGYLIASDGRKMHETDTKDIAFDEQAFEKNGVLYDDSKKLLIVAKDDFVNLRSNPTKDGGESALSFDKQRIKLLTTIYERLNYDLEYDGPGRLMFRLKDNYGNAGDNEMSTSEIINQTTTAKQSRKEQAVAEAEALGKQIKNSKSDSVILYSNMFENFDHLPRVTKATDFFKYLDDEGVILSQVIGISPTLIGIGKISGNVSMEKIIDNAMLNEIIPIREKFAIQISSMLASKIGVDKIYFDKYDLKQSVDDNDKRLKVVTIIEKLKNTGYESLADKFATILSDDLENNFGGKLKKLKANVSSRLKKLFRRDEKNG